MSSSKDNNIYKKTSFLAGNNSSFIEEFYSDYLSNPDTLPEGWRSFFDGLKDNEEIITKNLLGPSWSPKKIKKTLKTERVKYKENKSTEGPELTEQATKDSVRAIMLVRAYRIRGHLISNLDPLNIQERKEHLELKPETYGFYKRDYDGKIFSHAVFAVQDPTLT